MDAARIQAAEPGGGRLRHLRVLTDGKIGDLVQCRGIAARLDAELVDERVVRLAGWRALPLLTGVPRPQRADRPDSPVAPHRDHGWPDLVLASGRRTLPFLKTLRRAAPEVRIAFLKDPRGRWRDLADVIWAPSHDRLPDDPRFLATDTSPHGLTQDRLAAALERAGERFGALEGPTTGIVLGGDTGSVRWSARSSHALATLLADALRNEPGTVLVTTSRRTPAVLAGAVRAALPRAWFDDGTENAYAQILAVADRVMVTGDSHNMVSEALVRGAPVHVHRPPRLSSKLHRFLDTMTERGAVRTLRAPLERFDGLAVDASAEIARGIRERLFASGG